MGVSRSSNLYILEIPSKTEKIFLQILVLKCNKKNIYCVKTQKESTSCTEVGKRSRGAYSKHRKNTCTMSLLWNKKKLILYFSSGEKCANDKLDGRLWIVI